MRARLKRVLIGTSEKDILRCARVIVRHHLRARGGVIVSSVAGRDDLVRRAATEKFDLIILFGQTLLPGRDRVNLPLENSVRAIQEVKANGTTPILALSSMPETKPRLLAAGADAFLAMPFTIQDFTAMVDRCDKQK